MSERTDRMISSLAPWEREDPHVVAVMVAAGEEDDRIEALMLTVRDQAWPHRADDTYGLLALHERTLGLPVAPEGVTVAQRRGLARAAFARRKDGRLTAWSARMDQLVGAGQWTAAQNAPGPNQLSVELDVLPSSGLASAVQRSVERFTPAHVEVILSYVPTFFAGESLIGETEL